MSVESKRLNPDYPAMEQEYSDTNDFAPSCSTGQGFGGGLRDSYSSARGGSSFESRGGGFRGRDSPRHDRGGRGDFGSPGRSGDRPMGGSYGVDRRGPPQRHSSMDRSYSDSAQPAMRRGKQIVAPVKVQPKSISLNRKKGEPDASKPKVAPVPPRPNDNEVAGEKPEVVEKDKGDVLRDGEDSVNASKFSPKTVKMEKNEENNTCRYQVTTPYPIPKNFQITFGFGDRFQTVKMVKMEKNEENNTCRYQVTTPYPIPENFQITFGFDDRHNFDGRLGPNYQSTSTTLPRQPDLYQPGLSSDKGLTARRIGKSGFGKTVPWQYDEETSQYGQPGTLHGNYQQEQQRSNGPIIPSLPPPYIFRIQDKTVRQTLPTDVKSSQPLRQIPQHLATASRPVSVDRQLSTVSSVDSRKGVPPRIGVTFVPAGATDPAPYHFYCDQFVDINQRGKIKNNDTNSGEQILVAWLLNLDRKHTQEENNRTDIEGVVRKENRCRRFFDELEADRQLIINKHIEENHIYIKENKTTFNNILSAYLAIKTTLFFGRITSRFGRFILEMDLKWPVGFDGEDPLYYCRVILDSNGVLITAYPIRETPKMVT